jgi:hypothetical protein
MVRFRLVAYRLRSPATFVQLLSAREIARSAVGVGIGAL